MWWLDQAKLLGELFQDERVGDEEEVRKWTKVPCPKKKEELKELRMNWAAEGSLLSSSSSSSDNYRLVKTAMGASSKPWKIAGSGNP